MDISRGMKIGAAVVGGLTALGGAFFAGKKYGQMLYSPEHIQATNEFADSIDARIVKAAKKAIEKAKKANVSLSIEQIEKELWNDVEAVAKSAVAAGVSNN